MEKSKRPTGWTPTVVLGTGFAETIAWIDKHRERYRAQEYAV